MHFLTWPSLSFTDWKHSILFSFSSLHVSHASYLIFQNAKPTHPRNQKRNTKYNCSVPYVSRWYYNFLFHIILSHKSYRRDESFLKDKYQRNFDLFCIQVVSAILMFILCDAIVREDCTFSHIVCALSLAVIKGTRGGKKTTLNVHRSISTREHYGRTILYGIVFGRRDFNSRDEYWINCRASFPRTVNCTGTHVR